MPPLTVAVAALALACSDATGPEGCGGTPLEGASCLLFVDGGELSAHRSTITSRIEDGLSAVRARIPIEGLRIHLHGNAPNVIPEIGIGGNFSGLADVHLYFDPGHPDFDVSLQTELVPLLAHEIHHVARNRRAGYGGNLLRAMVSEGLADHFSIEITGIDPPLWSSALSTAELEEWRANARENWFNADYNHSAWFFGTGSVPRWAGYSIGFAIVDEFLDANPGERASTLLDDPAERIAGG